MQTELRTNLGHNYLVNVLDATFFGAGLGFASYVTVIPLFIDSLTDHAVIIGLVASFLMIGWQVPQLLTSAFVARLRRYKPTVLLMSMNERVPFFLLAIVAMSVPVIGVDIALVLAVALVAWQALGGGFTATSWQSMIAKIFPEKRRGAFYGAQSAAANLTLSLGAIGSGFILTTVGNPHNFGLCFFIAGICMMISFAFLAMTREPAHEIDPTQHQESNWTEFKERVTAILSTDRNFRGFIVCRILIQFVIMAIAFYAIYAKRRFGLDEYTVGTMAALLTLTQMVASPLMGWLGDRWGHCHMLTLGTLAATASAFVALTAVDVNALYIAFALSGITQAMQWTSIMSITAEFGLAKDRPYYIGLSNTLIAPATFIAPLIGGALADNVGFEATFGLAIAMGAGALILLQFVVKDPRRIVQIVPISASSAAQ